MHIIQLKIHTTDLQLIKHIVTTGFSDFDKKYVNSTDDMIIASSEQSISRNGTAIMNLVVMKKIDDHIIADVIGAAGGQQGWGNMDFGAEKAFANDMAIRINYHCGEKDIRVQKVS